MERNHTILKENVNKAGKEKIVFKVKCFEEEKIIESYTGEYRNLMVLLNEKFYLENFGECRGMGRCCTCAVEIRGKKNCLVLKQRNEASTLGKIGLDQPNIRLACQILIDEELDDAEVTIGYLE